MKYIIQSLVFCLMPLLFCGYTHGQNNAIGSHTEEQLKQAIYREKNDTKSFMRTLALGEYYKSNNIHRADSLTSIITRRSRTLGADYRFKAILFCAEIADILGDKDEYSRLVVSLKPFLEKSKSPDVHYQVYSHLGRFYSSNIDIEEAKNYLALALKLAKKARNNANISETYSNIALNFMLSNEKDSSFYFTNEAIQFGRRSANKSVMAESFNTQARIYAYFGQIDLSVAKNYFSLQLVSGVNDLPKMARYTREIGQSQLLISNLSEAEKYFKQSIEYSKQIYDQRQVALGFSNLGTVYKKKKDYEKAIEYNAMAINSLILLNDYNGLGEAHNNLGVIHTEQRKYDLAAQNFNKALVYYEGTNNRERIAGVYHNVGTVFQQQKKYTIALNYLNRSVEIRKQFGSKNQIYYTYRIIADVYRDIGKDRESLQYMDLYLDFLDSNTSVQESVKIAELSELYRSEERERLISMQADSIERQRQERTLTSTKLENTELKNNQKTYVILGFVIIIVLGGIIGFYRYNQTSIKQQQKEAEMLQTLLRSQMNPHFIFNSMSVIQSYIYDNDIKNSSKFLVNFSRLIRLILENSPKEFIPISVEVEILQKYLETQKLRFEERFEFSVEVDDLMMVENAMIPPMITQPFIENAIEHGQLHTIEGGFIRVIFEKKEDMLQIKIEDNGIGRKKSEKNKKSKEHTSMALNITRQRINNLNNKYKTSGYMQIEDFDLIAETGTKVLIALPYQVDAQTKKNGLPSA
jgi:tetratricopeptide (TPR) repeat protein